jgi:hypothetical protein
MSVVWEIVGPSVRVVSEGVHCERASMKAMEESESTATPEIKHCYLIRIHMSAN